MTFLFTFYDLKKRILRVNMVAHCLKAQSWEGSLDCCWQAFVNSLSTHLVPSEPASSLAWTLDL